MKNEQKTLTSAQIEAFYHDNFVNSQVRDYLAMVLPFMANPRMIIDVGGGCGFFALSLNRAIGVPVRVLDMDPASVMACHSVGVEAELGDALVPQLRGDEDIVCFNLVLHHLVAGSEDATVKLQKQALVAWRGCAKAIFVNEYIYDAWFLNLSGALIFLITRSKVLSALASAISRLVPSLHANTFGVGVRFRSSSEWCEIFKSIGYNVVSSVRGAEEQVSFARRLLLIRSCRRDSFMLVPLRGMDTLIGAAVQ